VAAYRSVFESFGADRPVVVRLADIGGDKAVPYLEPVGREFARTPGQRALLLVQLRAIWRAGGLAGVVPHVTAPMVSSLDDARALAELRDSARAQVAAAGDPLPERMISGVMIELSTAVSIAAELAPLVDFFSIGTNDLTQSILGTDRTDPASAGLADSLHPAVLDSIAAVVSAAKAAGIPVTVCGEMAGDPM
jgi:phosphoenolpyruvate-protein kinase (PTS system EI component)